MIAIACDHAGFRLKEELSEHLKKMELTVKDYGTYDENSVDYPEYAKKACAAVIDGECDRAILICGTGIGMSMVANKIRGIRAAVCTDCYTAKFTRRHNDANVLCLGARVLGTGLAFEIVETFLSSKFEGGKHKRRIDMFE